MKLNRRQLKVIRSVYRLSLEEMAQLLGYTTGYVHQVENGTNPITKEYNDRVVEAFELTTGKLRGIARTYRTYNISKLRRGK